MSVWRVLINVCIGAAVAATLSGCNLFDKLKSPTEPSAIAPPAAGAPIRYSAIGASDANGVGASVVCAPFAPCENGTGYVPTLARQLRSSHEVTLVNLGIPGAVLSPTIHDIARRNGRDIPANFVEQEMPFVPTESTLVTIFGGGNDTNALADAIDRGAAGADVRGYIDTQVRAFGADYDRIVRGVRARAANAFMIVINLPNLAALPYSAGYPQQRRQVLQQISVGFSREANRLAGTGVVVLDLMCDPQASIPSRFSSDGFHPNDAGYSYLADRLLAIASGASSSPAASCSQMAVVPPL
jgi:lysophospholipase L1-like esterase